MGVKTEESAPVANVHVPIPDNLLEVPSAKAVLASFPLGCSVLYTNATTDLLAVSMAIVEAVFIDLSPEKSSRDYFYKISLQNESTSAIAGEKELQWAPTCPVWMKPLEDTDALEWKRAVIIGSYQEMVNADPQYSVQEVESGSGLFHGVAKEHLRYRATSDAPPTIKADTGSVPVLQSSPAVAKLENRFSSAFESPTSVVETLPDSVQQPLLKRPDPLRQVSDVLAAMPSPLKRTSALSAQPVVEAGNPVKYDQQVSPPKKSAMIQSDSPTESVLSRGAEDRNERMPTGGVSSKTASPLKRSLQPEQPVSNGARAAAGDGNTSVKQAPIPKKAKLTKSGPSTETAMTHNVLTSQMDLQNSVNNNATEQGKETAGQVASRPPMRTSQGSSAWESLKLLLESSDSTEPITKEAGASPVEDTRHGTDQGELRTLTIKIPQFADPIFVRGKTWADLLII